MRKTTITFMALCVAGCATVHDTYAPDGRPAYALNCSGMARGWDKCYSKAGELCGTRGYDVLDRSGEAGAVFGGGATSFGGGSVMERSMTVACKTR